jgi:arylformamidase
MNTRLRFGEMEVSIDLSRPIDLSIPLDFHGAQPRAFFLPRASSQAFEAGTFVGDVRRGGSANCETVVLTPHGNGTHTECVGHIAHERVHVGAQLKDAFVFARLITVALEGLEESSESYDDQGQPEDKVITRRGLEKALEGFPSTSGLIVRTSPNGADKRSMDYSGRNPAYLTHDAMRYVREREVEHLLVDLPSVDREEDAGQLTNHHIFWRVDGRHVGPQTSRWTITEMIFVPDEVPDGLYVLNLQIPHFLLDAAPSRPLVFAVEPTSSSSI